MVSDHPTKVSVALVKGPDSTSLGWCGKWPLAPSSAASYWSSPMMLRTASLSLQVQQKRTEREAVTNKGRSVFMRLTDLPREARHCFSILWETTVSDLKSNIWTILHSFPTHCSAVCPSEATWWFNLKIILNTPGEICNSAFSCFTSHEVHLKDPIWSAYLNKIHRIIFMLQIWKLHVPKPHMLRWKWIIQQSTSVSGTGGSDATLHWAGPETANRSCRSRKWNNPTSKHMLKLNGHLQIHCIYCVKLRCSRARFYRFPELEPHLHEKLKSKNDHQEYIDFFASNLI